VNTFLITGATGAIGSVLARVLLEEPSARLRMIIRAKSSAHLEERLRRLYEFWKIDPDNRSVSARIQAQAGDVTLPRLGLDESTYRRLVGEVTHVVHSAGDVRLNRPLEEARQSAVDSTRYILSFATDGSNAGRFQKLEFVSTVGVAGRMEGLVPERAFSEPRRFRNSYEAAKAQAETLLVGEMEKGLPATIHRPSMVVGNSQDGRIIQFQVFYYLCELLSGRRTRGIVPDTSDIRLDIVPVDYVARAIHVSSQRTDSIGRIFHLCAGPSQAPTINDLARHVRDFFISHGRAAPPVKRISPALVRTLLPLAALLSSAKRRRSLRSLTHFLDYLDEPQTFANASSQAYFSSAGVSAIPVKNYLDTVLSYYVARAA
jgi:UDP-glucose 4-epimerase